MKSQRVYLRGSIAILFGAGLALNCGGSARVAGSVGGSCLLTGACDSGLVCLSEICVKPAAAAGDAGGAGIGAGGSGGVAAMGGTGGSTLGMSCAAATTMVAPSDGLIADFAGPDGGLEINGGVFTYPLGSASTPAHSVLDGVLHVTEDAPATSAIEYLGFGVGFKDCVDATAFTGVSFTISGSFSGCTMQYATGDVEHQDSTTDSYFATGPAGSYPPQRTLTANEITAAPQTLMMPFTGSTIFGSPQTPLDKKKLVLVLWQFTVPAAATSTADAAPAACVADITIDNVSFY
jgi:hypothetical protein